MMPRVIPCLLLRDKGLVKTVKFRDETYVGDPLNAVTIFNEKEVDELVFLDISATVEGRKIRKGVISQIAEQCFMPFAYGGGVRCIEDMKEIFRIGAEKIIINSYAVENPAFIKQAADTFGSQSVVVSIDVKKKVFGDYEVYIHRGKTKTKLHPVEFAVHMENNGAGELLLNSIDRDGMMGGYDIELIQAITKSVSIPVIACGGAGKIEDFSSAVKRGGASAVAAGSMFVFYGALRAVLINYPMREEIITAFQQETRT